jgi:hypothetical protein
LGVAGIDGELFLKDTGDRGIPKEIVCNFHNCIGSEMGVDSTGVAMLRDRKWERNQIHNT